MAIIIAREVNKPKNIVGTKFDKDNTEKPKAIVIDVVSTACPTELCEFFKDSIIEILRDKFFRTLYKSDRMSFSPP